MPQFNLSSLSDLSAPIKALFSAFLITIGCGYLVAIFYLYAADMKPYLAQGMTMVQGLQMKYHGARGETRLEAALKGPMANYGAPQQHAAIIQWIHDGATVEGFTKVQPIFTTVCAQCHSAKSGLVALTSYQEVRKMVALDNGASFTELASVSHIHLFGISLIFLLTGAIFSLSRMNATAKLCILVLPYVAIWADIGSWWLTKLDPVFAYVVIIGGGLMGISMAVQVLVPLWEMWVRHLRATS